MEISGKNLKRAIDYGLVYSDMDQTELAKKAKMHRQSLTLMKQTGSTKLSTLIKLLDIMGGEVVIKFSKRKLPIKKATHS